MRDPKRIREFCNELAGIWETRCLDWRFGQLLVNVIDRDPWFLEEDDMMRVLEDIFILKRQRKVRRRKLFDKEKFRENQELESTGYAAGYAFDMLQERCLIFIRYLEVVKNRSDSPAAEVVAEKMGWTKELEIARELYAGLMTIAHGKRLYRDYCQKVFDYGYSESFIKPESLDL